MNREQEKNARHGLMYSEGSLKFKNAYSGKVKECVNCKCKNSKRGMHTASNGDLYCGYCYETIQTVGIKDRVPPPRDENDE